MERKHPEARCEDCSLQGRENKYAPGYGKDGAKVAIIGEAPGYKEAREGRPFVGPSGQLLDTVLAHVGLDRSEIYVDNVVACRPPDNRTPSPAEVRCCWPRLRQVLTDAHPETIVALGNTAAKSILGVSTGITSLRVGPPKHSPYFPEARVIPTVHPAYCLRNADAFPHFVTDLEKITRFSTGSAGTTWEPPVYKAFEDWQDAVKVIGELHDKYDDLFIDIEVGIEKDIGFDHPERYQFLCIGIAYAKGKVVVIGEKALQHSSVIFALRGLLQDSRKRWSAHNGKFDLAGLEQYGSANLYFDTMLASYAVDERPGIHGLEYLGVELLGTPSWKSEIHQYTGKSGSYALVPRDVLYRYNAWDCSVGWDLKEHYEQTLTEEERRLHDFLVEVSNALRPSEMAGLSVDIAYLDHLTEHYLDGLQGLEVDLRRWVDNPRSPQQVKRALTDLFPAVNIKDTRKDTLKDLQLKVGNVDQATFLGLMLKHRREQKLYGTYVKGTRKRLYKDRVHPTFLLHGTTTGRLACRNPNLQNVPRESSIRRLFVPGPGNVFVQADYATIELRVQTTEAEDEFLAAIFREGQDIHNVFCEVLFGEGWDDDPNKDKRTRTKAFVYGISYGREAFSIAQEFKIPVEDARKQMDKFTSMIPATMEYRERIRRSILTDQEDLVTRFGRHRRFWLITEDNKVDVIKEAYAFTPQSTASDINLHSLVRLRRLGLDVRLPVHDSIMVECRADEANDTAQLMKTTMEQTALEVYSDFVPFPVDVEIGTSWGDLGKGKYTPVELLDYELDQESEQEEQVEA